MAALPAGFSTAKRSLEQGGGHAGLQGFFAELGVTREGRAFPSRREVHAAEMAGDDDSVSHVVSSAMYETPAFLGRTIELRARPGALVGAVGFDGEPVNTFWMAKHVSAEYDAPNGKGEFTVRDLCAIMSDFSPPASTEEMDDEALGPYGHFDILQSLTHVPGTQYTFEVKWVRDPNYDPRAARAVRDAKDHEKRAGAEASNPRLRGVGAFGKDGACAGDCGYFAVFGSAHCTKCALPAPLLAAEPCGKCGRDLSALGPMVKARHLTKCNA